MGVKQIVQINDFEWLWKEKILTGGERCYTLLPNMRSSTVLFTLTMESSWAISDKALSRGTKLQAEYITYPTKYNHNERSTYKVAIATIRCFQRGIKLHRNCLITLLISHIMQTTLISHLKN